MDVREARPGLRPARLDASSAKADRSIILGRPLCVVAAVCLSSVFLACFVSVELGSSSPAPADEFFVPPLTYAQPEAQSSIADAFDDVEDGDWPMLENMTVDVSGEEESMRPRIGRIADWLLEIWAMSSMLRGRKGINLSEAGSPLPPHLEDCLEFEHMRRQLDERGPDGSWPPWPLFGGTAAIELGLGPVDAAPKELLSPVGGQGGPQAPNSTETLLEKRPSDSMLGPLPPWVSGSDEDNLVLTRRVQRDLWLLQHPRDCNASGARFYVAKVSWPSFQGVGSLLQASVCLLADAIKLKRVLVLSYHMKMDHDLCKGHLRGSWTCYFVRETSQACYDRAMEACNKGEALLEGAPGWKDAVVVQRAEKLHWSCGAPDVWGSPWQHIHPSIQVHGELLRRAQDDSHRWFRAQALRYLMRYPSTRLCLLTNRARHSAFGTDAALIVARSLAHRKASNVSRSARLAHPLKPFWDGGELFQGGGKLMSMHVRQGDKKGEMIIHPFSDYMVLAETVRDRFPEASNVWLSTEMHSVVEVSKEYKGWRFFHTKITRQGQSDKAMASYERDLGPGISTDNAFVNLMISTGSDYFVGTMGSTWSVIIDDMRRTSGKEPRGLLTVNKDRFWMTPEERMSKLGLKKR